MTNLATGRYTWDDFIGLHEDDLRELIDGELVEIEVPSKPHERAVMMIGYFLTAWAERGHGGFALPSGYKIRVSSRRGVMPDAQFYRADNPAAAGQDRGLVDGRPDLVVEVLSRSSRSYDRVTKLGWYASVGVPEYWLVDTDARTLERLVLGGDTYAIAMSLHGDALFKPPSFEGLEVPLAKLWSK